MKNTTIHPTIHKINTELNKLNQIIENTKTNNYHFRTLLKNCNLSTPSSSSSVLFDDLPSHPDVEGIFHQNTSKNVSSIHSNNLSDTFNRNENSIGSKHVTKDKKGKKTSLFKKHHSGINFLSEKNQSNHRSTMEPSKETIRKAKLIKSNTLKSKKEIISKVTNIHQSKEPEKILILDAEKKMMINSKSNSKYRIQIDLKKEKTSKIRKVTKKKDKDASNFEDDKIIAPTKTQESTHTEGLKSKRNKENNYVSVPLKEKNFKNIMTHRHSSNKFKIDLEKEVDAKITDLKINKKVFELEKKYFLSSIRVTKKELEKMTMSHNKTLSTNDTLRSIFDVIKEVLSSLMSESNLNIDKEKKKRIYETLNKPEVFLRTINEFPDILKNLNSIPENLYKTSMKKMREILEKTNKFPSKSVTKTSLYSYFVSLNEYLDFFVKNQLITHSKVNKNVFSKNEQLLSCRNAKNEREREKTHREMLVKSPVLKKREISERKKDELRNLKRSSTVKILRKSKF